MRLILMAVVILCESRWVPGSDSKRGKRDRAMRPGLVSPHCEVVEP